MASRAPASIDSPNRRATVSATAGGELGFVNRPLARRPHVLVAHDGRHAASLVDGRIEHRGDAERDEVGLAKLRRERIGHHVVHSHDAAQFERAENATFRAGVLRYRVEWACVGLSLPLLFAFAQTMNVNHGGTPGMSRYALWLLPLAAPLVDAAYGAASVRWRQALTLCVTASAMWSAIYFAPARGEGFLEPTPLARYQWQHYPDLMDPLPEIFAERTRHQESVNVFAATPSCSKALLQSGQWPFPCTPTTAPIPPECRPDGVLCYANRTSRGYVFHVTSRRGGLSLRIPQAPGLLRLAR